MESQYDKKYNLRLPSAVYENIEALCTKSERSGNEQIVYMLKTWEEQGAFNARLAKLEDFIYAQQEDKRKRVSGE
jgi:hypothetical protein